MILRAAVRMAERKLLQREHLYSRAFRQPAGRAAANAAATQDNMVVIPLHPRLSRIRSLKSTSFAEASGRSKLQASGTLQDRRCSKEKPALNGRGCAYTLRCLTG